MSNSDERFEKEKEAEREVAKMEISHHLKSFYSPEEIGYEGNDLPDPRLKKNNFYDWRFQFDHKPQYRNWYLMRARKLFENLAILDPEYQIHIKEQLEENDSTMSKLALTELEKLLKTLANE